MLDPYDRPWPPFRLTGETTGWMLVIEPGPVYESPESEFKRAFECAWIHYQLKQGATVLKAAAPILTRYGPGWIGYDDTDE